MTKYETEMRNKKEALEMFLDEKKEVKYLYDNIFESESGAEYMVLTDDEADVEAENNIRGSLWAFDANFILEHMSAYRNTTTNQDKDIISALEQMQRTLCETANELVYALIGDYEQFVEDAIEADGRGHFISIYDGEENEQNGFYIYRTE